MKEEQPIFISHIKTHTTCSKKTTWKTYPRETIHDTGTNTTKDDFAAVTDQTNIGLSTMKNVVNMIRIQC